MIWRCSRTVSDARPTIDRSGPKQPLGFCCNAASFKARPCVGAEYGLRDQAREEAGSHTSCFFSGRHKGFPSGYCQVSRFKPAAVWRCPRALAPTRDRERRKHMGTDSGHGSSWTDTQEPLGRPHHGEVGRP